MADETRLNGLKYNDSNNLEVRVDESAVGTVECGPNGLRYTGGILPRFALLGACTDMPVSGCAPFQVDDSGCLWSPPVAEYLVSTVSSNGNAAPIEIGTAAVWESPPIVIPETAAPDCLDTLHSYHVHGQVTTVEADLDAGSEYSLRSFSSDISFGENFAYITPDANGKVITWTGYGFAYSPIDNPGDSGTRNFSIRVTNNASNEGSIGIFEWGLKIVRTTLFMEQQGAFPLGGVA